MDAAHSVNERKDGSVLQLAKRARQSVEIQSKCRTKTATMAMAWMKTAARQSAKLRMDGNVTLRLVLSKKRLIVKEYVVTANMSATKGVMTATE